MTRVNFDMADPLLRQVDEVGVQRGFGSRAELFRYLAMDFVRQHDKKAPTNPINFIEEPGNQPEAEPQTDAEKRLHEIMENYEGFNIPPEAIVEIEKIAKERTRR